MMFIQLGFTQKIFTIQMNLQDTQKMILIMTIISAMNMKKRMKDVWNTLSITKQISKAKTRNPHHSFGVGFSLSEIKPGEITPPAQHEPFLNAQTSLLGSFVCFLS